jgi:nucleolar MIF4G domain-containing protein 1
MYWCYLYLFDAIGSELIIGLIEHFSQLTEENVELLTNIFRIAGFKLRKDDPMGLKKVFDLLQESARKVEDPPPRLRFMLDTLLDIKNNKKKLTTEDRIKFLKTWLKKTLTQRLGSTELKLQLTWQDLQTPHWRNLLTPSYKEAKINTTSFSPELEALAKAQHMSSETRKIIFCTIMSAEDYTDAFNKLLKMKKQEREIVRILVTCCGQEQVFNQYYYLLASKFCSYKSSFKYSFQYALWDTLKQLADFSIRKLSNIAKMYGFMISDLMLPLNVFKCINFDEVDSYVSVFLRIVLEQIFVRCDSDEISKIFTKIGSADKYAALSEGISIFIKQVIAKHPRKAFLVISTQDAIGGAKLLEEKIEVARNCLSIVDN